MGIDHSSHGILTVILPPEPKLGSELETVANIVRDGADCDIVVDFSNVDIVTSSNLSKLLRLNKLLGELGHRLVLCSVPSPIEDIFKIVGLNVVFEVTSDKSAALAFIKNLQPVKK